MRLEIDLTDEELSTLAQDVYENFPESSISLRCLSADYNAFLFKFRDNEDGQEYTVDRDKAMIGLTIFLDAVAKGLLPGIDLRISPRILDVGTWDGFAFDAALQCAIFEEVIYG